MLVAICGLSLLLVVALLRGFFSGFPGFPPSTKTNTGLRTCMKPAKGGVASSLNIVIYLFMTAAQ